MKLIFLEEAIIKYVFFEVKEQFLKCILDD